MPWEGGGWGNMTEFQTALFVNRFFLNARPCFSQVHKDLSGDDVRASVAMAKSRGRDRVRRTRDGKTKVLPFAAVAPGGEGTAGANLGPGTYAVEHYDPFARAPAFDFERVTGRPDAVGPHGERPTGLQLSGVRCVCAMARVLSRPSVTMWTVSPPT
jgi:hypothetical protein